MVDQAAPVELKPPTGHELTLLSAWLDVTKRYTSQLDQIESPWAEYLNDFGMILEDVLKPETP